MTSRLSLEILADPRDRKYYADVYSCCPPPLFLIIISLIHIGVYLYYWIQRGEPGRLEWPQRGDYGDKLEDVHLDSVLIYCPERRSEVWRYLSYFLVHTSWWHLLFNILVQILLGIPLEMVHGSGRVATIYLAGVLAGSLGSSLFDPWVCLVGPSGGVYSLLTSHILHLNSNYANMECGAVRVFLLILTASVEVGVAVYDRYIDNQQLSYQAHIWGCCAGFTIGLVVLKNYQQNLWRRWLWWLALATYLSMAITAICLIIFWR